MSWSQDISASASFFNRVTPKTIEGKEIKSSFLKWYRSLSWFDRVWPAKVIYSTALYSVTSYNDAEFPKSRYGLKL